MNFLKLKSILFTLVTIAILTIFLSSCEKENIPTKVQQEIELKEDLIYKLPKECNNMTTEELDNYLQNITPSELSTFTIVTNDLDNRSSCGVWKTVAKYCWYRSYTSCGVYNQDTRYYKKVRWCGSPNGGGYQVKYQIVGCC